MSTTLYTTSNGYSLEEDGRCHWWVKKDGWIVANSKTPYPLMDYLSKHITYRELTEMASRLNLNFKFIYVNGSSLSELEK